jgi:hypothetical protein
MRRWQLWHVWILVLPASAASPHPADNSLQQDPRLDVKVSIAQKDRPLREILAALRCEMKVPLRAGRDTADDKATLFLDERPAAEVMARIAGQFDFQWRPYREGYELVQTPASQARERALREQKLQAELSAVQAEMERPPLLVDTPRWRLEESEAEIAQRLQSEDMEASERDRLSEERAAIIEALHPGRAPAVAIYRSLTDSQVRLLLEGHDLWLSSAGGTLPPALAEPIRQAEREAMTLSPWTAFFELLGPERWPPANTELVVRLVDPSDEIEGPLPPGEPHLRLEFIVPIRHEGDWQIWGIPGWRADGKLPVPAVTPTKTDDPALMQPVALTLSRLVPPLSPEEQRAPDLLPDRGTWPPELPTLGDVSEALHQTTGLEIVADSFVRDRLDAETAAALNGHLQPVARLLDRVANSLDYTWRKEGNVLYFRSRHWPRNRAEEVPERFLRPFRQRVQRTGAATLDDLAGLAAALTDAQARGLSHYWGWYFQDTPALPPIGGSGGFYGCRRLLRFWASLTPMQRAAALKGVILPFSRLEFRQRQAYVESLGSLKGSGFFGELYRPAAPEEVAEGGFGCQVDRSPEMTTYNFAYYLAGETTAAREIKLGVSVPRS